MDINPEIKYRIKIVLLANEGYTVPEIREITNTHMTKQLESEFINPMMME